MDIFSHKVAKTKQTCLKLGAMLSTQCNGLQEIKYFLHSLEMVTVQSKSSRNLRIVSLNCSHSLENYLGCNRLERGIISSVGEVSVVNPSLAGRDAPAGNTSGFSPLLFSG